MATPTPQQVNEARELLRPYLRPTQLVLAERLGRDLDTQVFLKLETELPTKSFKPRGALYALKKTLEQRSIKGVVAASTGNHGAAVAYAARLAKLPATIFLRKVPTRSNALGSFNSARQSKKLSGRTNPWEPPLLHLQKNTNTTF